MNNGMNNMPNGMNNGMNNMNNAMNNMNMQNNNMQPNINPSTNNMQNNPAQMNHYMNNMNNMNNANRIQYNDEYVEVKDDKKKGKGKLLIIVLIIIIVLGVLAAVFLPSLLKNNDKKQEEEVKEEQQKEEETEDEEETDEDLITIDVNDETVTHDDNTSNYSDTVKELFNAFREDNDSTLYSLAVSDDIDVYKKYVALRSFDEKNKSSIKCTDLDIVFNEKNGIVTSICGDAFANREYYDDEGNIKTKYTQEDIKKKLDGYKVLTLKATEFVNHYNKLFGKDKLKKETFEFYYIFEFYYDQKRDLFELFTIGGGNEVYGPVVNQKIIDVVETGTSLQIKTEAEFEKKLYINYNFVKETETGNWIFKSREVK